jgi:exodeoxyribonuclease VII small subunit
MPKAPPPSSAISVDTPNEFSLEAPGESGNGSVVTGKPTARAAAASKGRVGSSASAAATPLNPMPATYEAALGELEQIVARIDAGQMPLDDLLTGYRRGADLLAFCRERLQAVEEQIKVLDKGVIKAWSPT